MESRVKFTKMVGYGLGAADMPSKQLIYRAVGDRRLCEKLSKVDVLIWDASARMIELVNALHHHLSSEESGLENLPFAGKQVIIVGEFRQLSELNSEEGTGV